MHDILWAGQFINQENKFFMKSSTLRRSNLSKEKMAVLEALSNYRHEAYDKNTPKTYIRSNKEKELDILWQNFKINQKSEKSPSVYLGIGFVAGAVSMLLLTTIIGFSARNIESTALSPKADKISNEKVKVDLIPPTVATEEVSKETASQSSETYTVQSGDTMGAILVRFYGSETRENRIKVMNANKITNPNKLSIGQKLILPMN